MRLSRWAQIIPDKAAQALAAGPTPLYGFDIQVVCGLQFRPGALGVLIQQALALQSATYTLTDRLNQIFQLVFTRCLTALKPRGSVVAIDVYAIQKQKRKCAKPPKPSPAFNLLTTF